MLRRKKNTAGFTLVELLISISLIAIVLTIFLIMFRTNIVTYFNLQQDATAQTQLAAQSMRVATVVRSAAAVTSAIANDLVINAYFYPSDAYVSQIHYYLSGTGNSMRLLADVTPWSANPPTGTLLTAKKKTYTIIDSYYQATGSSLFSYLSASGAVLTIPISNLQTIKGIQINLVARTAEHGTESTSVQVTLRNMKTNL